MFASLGHFSIVPSWKHVPRVTVDGVVFMRESFRYVPAEVPFLEGDNVFDRFTLARRWAAKEGLPRFVFYKVPEEPKPCFLDFESPIYVEIFAKMLAKATSVTISEMLPGVGESWLPDGEWQIRASCASQPSTPSRGGRRATREGHSVPLSSRHDLRHHVRRKPGPEVTNVNTDHRLRRRSLDPKHNRMRDSMFNHPYVGRIIRRDTRTYPVADLKLAYIWWLHAMRANVAWSLPAIKVSIEGLKEGDHDDKTIWLPRFEDYYHEEVARNEEGKEYGHDAWITNDMPEVGRPRIGDSVAAASVRIRVPELLRRARQRAPLPQCWAPRPRSRSSARW